MGMYDNITCKYKEMPVEHRGLEYQTKDMVNFLDHYVIEEDGTFYHEEYDIEDRSDPDAKGYEAMFGSMTRVNKRLVEMVDFTDTIYFYDFDENDEQIQYKVQYNKGKLTFFEKVNYDS